MSKEIQDLEKEIDEIHNIKDWGEKITKSKEIKEKIINQKEKLNDLLTNLNVGEFKKIKKKKDASLNDLFIEFDSFINKKLKSTLTNFDVKYTEINRNIDFNAKFYEQPIEFTLLEKRATNETAKTVNPDKNQVKENENN